MEANLSLGQTLHKEEVSIRNLVTLLMLTNSRSDQSVDQLIDRRSDGTLIGRPRDIGPPSMNPHLHIVVLLWWLTNIVVKISIKNEDS